MSSLLSLYEKHVYSQIQTSIETELINECWKEIPKSHDDIASIIKSKNPTKIRYHRKDDQTQEDLLKVFRDFHYINRFYTSQVKELLDNWFETLGSIECGHQPLYFGGASFLFNKVTYTSFLYLFLKEKTPLTPIFFIGDHDEIQNELVISRFPQYNSQSGLEIKSDFKDTNVLTPIYNLEKPSESILKSQIDKIKQNYKDLFKYSKIKPDNRLLLDNRLEDLLGMLKDNYYRSGPSFSDWITQLLGDIFLLKNELPIILIKGSDKGLRKLMLPYFEDLLLEENRQSIIKTINKFYYKIQESGFKPGLPLRENDYVPFFLECPKDISRDRIRLRTDGSTLLGTCPKCNEQYQISYDQDHPDLSDYYEFLSPRVDSRSIIANQLFKTTIRVTGGGETKYYAQLLPIFESLHIDPKPIIIKHPRIYYNTPWAEKKSQELKELGFINPLIHEKENYSRIGKLSKTLDKNESLSLILETKSLFEKTYDNLANQITQYENNKDLQKNRKIKHLHQTLLSYLSLVWGSYTSKKKIQEVSWNWIDLAIQTGIRDLTGLYMRSIKENMPISPTLWVSAGKFN
ncbi:MAG: bacillithiol biosynthesis BshC [Candidatus Thorarchaeota archaeon]